jgi:hypothetical protein
MTIVHLSRLVRGLGVGQGTLRKELAGDSVVLLSIRLVCVRGSLQSRKKAICLGCCGGSRF